MEPQTILQRFSKNSTDAREARAEWTRAQERILSRRDRDRTAGTIKTHGSSVPPRTWKSTSKTRTSTSSTGVGGSSAINILGLLSNGWSNSDDDGEVDGHGFFSTTRPGPSAAPAATAHDIDSDQELFDEHFADHTARAIASARSKRQSVTSPKSAVACPSCPTTGKGATSSSPRGSACKRRRDEKNDTAARGKPSLLLRQVVFNNDTEEGRGTPPGRQPRGRTEAQYSCSSASSGGETRDNENPDRRSSPRAISPRGGAVADVGGGGDGSMRTGSDTEAGVGGGGGSRKHNLPGSASSGRTDELQVEFGDSGSEFRVRNDDAAASTAQREAGDEEEGEEAEEETDDDGDLDDDDLDGDGEGLKPTLKNAPFEDHMMKPLVLTNEAGGERAEVPASANRYLKDYQKQGVEFMYRRVRHAEGPKGVILADDMGLGKTVQAISLLLALLEKTGTRQDLVDIKRRKADNKHVSVAKKPILIVCPKSVLPSWMTHLKTWGHFEAGCITSSGNSTGPKSLQRVERQLRVGLLEVVVVGEEMFSKSIDTLCKLTWLAVVFDEFHHYKNHKTNRYKAVQKLEKAKVFIGLTGTLVQNKLDEYWYLLDTIQRGCGQQPGDFKRHFRDPILRGRKRNASRADVLLGAERLKELSVVRDKVVLRRVKEVVLGDVLMGKIGNVVFCNLTPVQKLIYRTVLSLPEFKLLANARDPCICGRSDALSGQCCGMYPADENSEDGVDPRAVIWRRFHKDLQVCEKKPGCPYCCLFTAISKLQKLADHPCLLQVKPFSKYGDNEEKLREDIAFADVAFNEEARTIMSELPQEGGGGSGGGMPSGSYAGGGRSGCGGRGGDWDRRLARPANYLQLCRDDTCGKMKTLKVLLKRFRNKEKVLLFSYSTAMLDILEKLCISEGHSCLKLHGDTPNDQRQKMIDRFNRENAIESNVFLISTKAGGTGLNLQAASKVILYNVQWNPAQDAQAEDRACRIGQTKEVEVFRLVSPGTIEELMYMRQIYKLQVSSATMGEKGEGGLRQFEGVQGDPSQQGELWGISNLLKFSGESMLLELRQRHGDGLPPLEPQKDGLVIGVQEDIVNIVNSYAAAASTAMTGEDARQPEAGSGEETEGEEEFDDDALGGGGARLGGRNQNDELHGVVMQHDDMVAAKRKQELPAGSQESNINEVDMIMDDDETDDETRDGGGGGDDDDRVVPAGSFVGEDIGGAAAAAGDGAAFAAAIVIDDDDEVDVEPTAVRGVAAAGASPETLYGFASRVGLAGHGGAAATAAGAASPAVHANQPGWALAETQPSQHQGPPYRPLSRPMAPASSPLNRGGAGDRVRTGTDCGTVAGEGSAAEIGDGASGGLPEVDARAEVAAAVVGGGLEGRGGDGLSQRFIFAPAAQEPLGILGYDDLSGSRQEVESGDAEEGEEEEAQEEAQQGGESVASGCLDLSISVSSDSEDGNDAAGVGGTGDFQQPKDGAVDTSAPAESGNDSKDLDLALGNLEDVSYSAETQPPPGFV